MRATLYSLSLSHPSQAVRLMLERKGIEHRVVDLLPGFHPLMLRAAGFRGSTVPALKIDGRRVQHSVAAARLLEEIQPTPSLYPADPKRRRAVQEAEEWGERELQPLPRRIFRWVAWHNADVRLWLARDVVRMPLPGLMAHANKPLARYFAGMIGADEARVRADVASLPAVLDRVDALIADRTLGGGEPSAADFQIGTAVRVLLAYEDLRPLVAGRPSEDLARAVLPEYPGPIVRALPPAWLPA